MLDSSSEGLTLEGLFGAILFKAAMIAMVRGYEMYHQSRTDLIEDAGCVSASPSASHFRAPRFFVN